MSDRAVVRAFVFTIVTVLVTWLAAPAPEATANSPAPPRVEMPTATPLPVPHASERVSPTRALATVDPDDDTAEGEMDLNGNDIQTAVATYKVDNAGSLYELHSPQTEVPRLGSPKS